MIGPRVDMDKLREAVRAQMKAQQPNPISQTAAAMQIGISKPRLSGFLGGQNAGAGAMLAICRWLNRDPYSFYLPPEPDKDRPHQPSGVPRPKGKQTAKGLAAIRSNLEGATRAGERS